MSRQLCSAGLLYVYLSGYEENGRLSIQPIDSYRYIENGLYHRIMETAERSDCDDNAVHIFAVVGPKDKANTVHSIIENDLKENFKRILANKSIKINTEKLDGVGNTFFRCVQEFFCEQPGHFPKRIHYVFDDIIVGGICCSRMPDEAGDSVTGACISLWMEREAPMLCGQQLMTRSFFMRDFIGRKVITSIPDEETGLWRMVFEGGHQIYMDSDAPYTKETLHPNDLGAFCASNTLSVLINPVYAYGKWFQPNDICEEWHKVFLYLCAVSETEWDQSKICRIYEQFLIFLERNICMTMEVPPFLHKKHYLKGLLKLISDFRGFLQGNDEPVISRDLHQTLNSRFVYLPHLWPLLNPETPRSSFSASLLREMVDQAICETETYKKGTLWEDASAYFLSNATGWKITGRRIRAGAQEIDLSIANISLDNDLWQLGAYILVECKNWNTRVDIHQIRNIAHISNMKGNKTAILFAANGITSDAQEEIYRLVAGNLSIICITAGELNNFIQPKIAKR